MEWQIVSVAVVSLILLTSAIYVATNYDLLEPDQDLPESISINGVQIELNTYFWVNHMPGTASDHLLGVFILTADSGFPCNISFVKVELYNNQTQERLQAELVDPGTMNNEIEFQRNLANGPKWPIGSEVDTEVTISCNGEFRLGNYGSVIYETL